jgi:hypothetical protein
MAFSDSGVRSTLSRSPGAPEPTVLVMELFDDLPPYLRPNPCK